MKKLRSWKLAQNWEILDGTFSWLPWLPWPCYLCNPKFCVRCWVPWLCVGAWVTAGQWVRVTEYWHTDTIRASSCTTVWQHVQLLPAAATNSCISGWANIITICQMSEKPTELWKEIKIQQKEWELRVGFVTYDIWSRHSRTAGSLWTQATSLYCMNSFNDCSSEQISTWHAAKFINEHVHIDLAQPAICLLFLNCAHSCVHGLLFWCAHKHLSLVGHKPKTLY